MKNTKSKMVIRVGKPRKSKTGKQTIVVTDRGGTVHINANTAAQIIGAKIVYGDEINIF
jgi:hypothetical protein